MEGAFHENGLPFSIHAQLCRVFRALHRLFGKEHLQFFLVQLAAYYAQSARVKGCAVADVYLAGHIVKVQPLSVRALDYALRAQYHAICDCIGEGGELALNLFLGELLARLRAPAGEHFVGMVMVVMLVIMSAAALIAVLVVVFVLIFIIIVVMMLMVVSATALIAVSVIVLVLILIVVMVMMLMVVSATALIAVFVMVLVLILIVVMVMMFMLALNFLRKFGQLVGKGGGVLHCGKDFLTVQFL